MFTSCFTCDNTQGLSFLLSREMEISDQPILVICENDNQVNLLVNEITISEKTLDRVVVIPDTETLPYDLESPHAALVSARASAFHRLATTGGDRHLFVLSVPTLLKRISSKKHWLDSVEEFSVGMEFITDVFEEKVFSLGYQRVDFEVINHSEYLINNNIIDIFPMGMKNALRFCFEDGKIFSIHVLDHKGQKTDDKIESFKILPSKEMPIDKLSIQQFRKTFRTFFQKGFGDPVYEAVSSRKMPRGIEFLLPLFQEELASVVDFMPKTTSIIVVGDLSKVVGSLQDRFKKRFQDVSKDKSRRVISPEHLWLSYDETKAKLNSFSTFSIDDLRKKWGMVFANNLDRKSDLRSTVDYFGNAVKDFGKVLFTMHTNVREEQLSIISKLMALEINEFSSINEFLKSDKKAGLIYSKLDKGFNLEDKSLIVLTETEIFGQPIYARSESNAEEIDYSSIQDLKSLEIGDPIVHVKYGVGRYSGLKKINVNAEKEFFTISYAESATAYVPIDELHFVSRYAGIDVENAPMDIMGSEKWLKGLTEAIGNVKNTAQGLLAIQANRIANKGILFKKPDFSYIKFAREFQFQETTDQKRAIEDIISDMTSDKPMDRIVVGDVGFGKTEVLMRAAFIAAQSGYQVAVLVPTTLLAQQHLRTFERRFQNTPFKIECLSRFDKDNEKQVIHQLSIGEINIVIGTHRLLQKDIQFKKMGLLIIDEEHRFGVNHKEQIKQIRKNIDVLSLTATPIPRSLSMSLTGIREMSVIATPPSKRLSIRTIVCERNDDTIIEAIERETQRNGQIFFLHNNIESIEETTNHIKSLMPNLRVDYAHGQMGEMQLENIMARFYKHEFDVLVCTTIIETGIDVPNANTIIINNADKLGLAQLHQLRGRVGRSHHQAYAYLITKAGSLTENASKRLMAMEKATNLGEGYILANHDLEIRGAGELLGEEQSGHISTIGFSLYSRLLSRAIDLIRKGYDLNSFFSSDDDVKLDLCISAAISETYISNPQSRLAVYKRLVDAESTKDINQLQNEVQDRFGEIDSETKKYFRMAGIQCIMKNAGIKKITCAKEKGHVILSKKSTPKVKEINGYGSRLFSKFSKLEEGNYQFIFSSEIEKEKIESVERLVKNINIETSIIGG